MAVQNPFYDANLEKPNWSFYYQQLQNAPTQTISISSLKSDLREIVDGNYVADYPSELLVVKYNNVNHIFQGHWKAYQARQGGATTISARVFNYVASDVRGSNAYQG